MTARTNWNQILGAFIFAFSAPASQLARADVSVRIDTGFAQQILEEACSQQTIDEQAIRASRTAQDMVRHFSAFRKTFSMDAYVEARRALAKCQVPEKDYFRIATVIDNLDRLKNSLDSLRQEEKSYSTRAAQMIKAYSPEQLHYEGTAIPVVGSPSCGGWSSGSTFYLDLPCIESDNEGMLYLIAHESYHGAQDRFMPEADNNANPFEKIMHELVREGSAQVVADVQEIDNPGAYAALGQRVARANSRRVQENFDLFEMALHYLDTADDDEAFAKVYRLGFSGLFDSPFYSVGARMINTIDQAFGRQALICVLGMAPEEFPLAYAAARERTPDNWPAPPLKGVPRRTDQLSAPSVETYRSCLN